MPRARPVAVPPRNLKPKPSARVQSSPLTSPSPSPSLSPPPSQQIASSSSTLVASTVGDVGKRDGTSPLKRKRSVDTDSDDEPFPDLNTVLRSELPETVKVEAELEVEEPVFKQTWLPATIEPGAAILVKRQKNWWPAYLVDFTPARNLAEQKQIGDRYLVQELGQAERSVKRSSLLFMVDDGIANCPLGEIHTSRIAITSDALTRAVTPDPAPPEPEPEGGTSFSQLSRLEQLYQIRSHLHDIILETYQPAQWRNDLFHGVSNQRDTLGRFIQYGDISEAEIADFFIPELERWALRAERRQPTHEPILAEPPRPTGSARYESLNPTLRRQYIADVLLPESIIQICILSEEIDQTPNGYKAARTRLTELRENDPARLWEARREDLNDARSRKRIKLGLPSERKSRGEIEREKLNKGGVVGWTGRSRKMGKNDLLGEAPLVHWSDHPSGEKFSRLI